MLISFDGLQRHCIKWKKAKRGKVRCAKFKRGGGHPTCPPSPKKNLRSRYWIHPKSQCGSGGGKAKRRAR